MKIRLNNKIIRTLTLALLFGLAFLPSAVFADEPTWGPVDRDTYTMEVPAGYAAFNSITNNPTLGDERKFVRVAQIPSDCDQNKIDYSKPIEGPNTPTPVANNTECVLDFKQSVEIEPGEQYMVYIYYHNNAATNLNSSTYNARGVAKNVKMYSSYPELILGQRGEISAEIEYTKKRKNADDSWSWDDERDNVWAKAYLTNSDNDQIALSYVTGSARHYNVGWVGENGKILPLVGTHADDPKALAKKDVSDTLFTDEGILLGYHDGISEVNTETSFGMGYVYGCEPFHGVVTYVLQAAEYRGEVDKKVSVDGGTTYKEGAIVEPGAELTYLVEVSNVGQTALTHVVLDDTLPEGLTLVPGSVELSKKGSTTWDKQNDSDEYNLGTIGSGQIVYIRYKAKVGTDYDCDGERITNVAKITYDGVTSAGITDEDEAVIDVRKTGEECEDKVTLNKEVSVNKGKTYKESVEILPGDTVTFRITFSSTGGLAHIVLKDVLPEGLTLVKDSAKWSKLDKKGDELDKGSVPNLSAFGFEVLEEDQTLAVTFEAKAGEDFDCKGKELTNTATLTYGSNETKTETDTAKVTVKKAAEECVEPEKNCKTNPEMDECKELPDTGPVEIAIFSMIVLGITGGTVYLILAKRTLKKMTASVINEQPADPTITAEPTVSDKDKTDGGALNA